MMTDKIDDGGPAFPRTVQRWNDSLDHSVQGMSLRDWFAGQALPAVIAATSAGQHMPATRDSDTHIAFAITRDAYFIADAMLAARKPLP